MMLRIKPIVFLTVLQLTSIACKPSGFSKYEYDPTLVRFKTLKNSSFNAVDFEEFSQLPDKCPDFENKEYFDISKLYPKTGFHKIYGYKVFNSFQLVLATYGNEDVKFMLLLDEKDEVKSYFKICDISVVENSCTINYWMSENYLLIKRVIHRSNDIYSQYLNYPEKSFVLLKLLPKGAFEILIKEEAIAVLKERQLKKYLN